MNTLFSILFSYDLQWNETQIAEQQNMQKHIDLSVKNWQLSGAET